jgi:hypothetical protein
MTRTTDRRRRPSVWTVIALLLFVAALTTWIAIRPDDADQDNRPISPLSPVATSSLPASEV